MATGIGGKSKQNPRFLYSPDLLKKYTYRTISYGWASTPTAKRDASAVLRFFRKAIRHHGEPEVVTVDKSGANTAALTTLNADKPDEETISIRQSKYLNNQVEQDHRNIKRRIRPIPFRRAQTILAGIELLHMIRKGGNINIRQVMECRPRNNSIY